MSSIRSRATGVYTAFANATNYLQSPLLLVVRLYWGWQFFQTGWGKLQDIPKVVDFFTSLGLPFPNVTAYVVGTSECVGGILLFLGLGSRLISLPLLADMLGAYVTADREALRAIFSEPGKFYAADPYTFLFAALLILVFGPGKISVDALIGRLIGREKRVFINAASAVGLGGKGFCSRVTCAADANLKQPGFAESFSPLTDCMIVISASALN